MSQEAQVRVAGPSRGVLAAATGALVALTSAATAFVVLTGTGGVVPAAPSLEPLPPAAAPPTHPPVVVLPPGALGLPVPAQVDGPRAASPGGERRTTPFVLAAPPASTGLRALVPELPTPVTAPAPVAVADAAPPPGVEPVPGRPTAAPDAKTVRRLERTLDRLPGRTTLSEQTDAPALDLLDAVAPSTVGTSAERRWDEQDEREQRHARFARRAAPAVPAVPAVVTAGRAIPAVPPVVAQPARRTPAVAQGRAGKPPQRSGPAVSNRAAATSSAGSGSKGSGSKGSGSKGSGSKGSGSKGSKHSAAKKSGGEKNSSRASRARSGGPRP